MSGLKYKVMGVVLSAALVFCTFPFPTGVNSLDRARFEQANANPAVAIPLVTVFGTALAAYGVYAAGTTSEGYSANLSSLYENFGNFYVGDIEAVLGTAITDDGYVNLGALGADVWNSISEWAQGLIGSGDAVEQSNSLVPGSVGSFIIGGLEYAAFDEFPSWTYNQQNAWNRARNEGYTVPVAIRYASSTSTQDAHFYLSKSSTPSLDVSNLKRFASDDMLDMSIYKSGSTWYYTYNKVNYISDSNANELTNLYSGLNIVGNYVANEVAGSEIASVEPGVLDGTAEVPTSTVQAWEPTDAALESGYSSADVLANVIEGNTSATEENTQTLEGVADSLSDLVTTLSPVAGLLSPIAGIADNVASIAAGWAGVITEPFAWLASWWLDLCNYWDTLLARVGEGNIIGVLSDVSTTLETGVTGTLDGISSSFDAMVNDVNSRWGTLTGWWEGLNQWLGVDDLTLEGVLEGVLSGALGISLSDALAQIQTALAEIVGAVEGVNFPHPDETQGSGEIELGIPFADTRSVFVAQLEEKAPFCYVVQINRQFEKVRGTYSDTPTFYYDLNFSENNPPFLGTVRIDAGQWLNYEVNGTSIAFLLRTAFNMFAIVMLLMLAYKAMQKAID